MARIIEGKSGCGDGDTFPAPAGFVFGDREFAVDYPKSRPVFKDAVLRPFHPDELRSEYSKAGVSAHYDGTLIGFRIKNFLRPALELCQDEDPNKTDQLFHIKTNIRTFPYLCAICSVKKPIHPGVKSFALF